MELTPKEKAKDLILQMIEVDKKLNKHPMSNDLAIDLSLLCVSEIQRFGSHLNIREPMMYWGMVSKELNKMKVKL
jgi:hypothetical protein